MQATHAPTADVGLPAPAWRAANDAKAQPAPAPTDRELLQQACQLILDMAKDTWSIGPSMSQAEFEDHWADDDEDGHARWVALATAAGCRPPIERTAEPGLCWECETIIGIRDPADEPGTFETWIRPDYRFINCRRHENRQVFVPNAFERLY